ncbi:restriction endonuclease LlaI [Planktothrix agardhii]|uniref:restriction endonuclease LlaI n=1 Tax=Planktothrix agardhii TaxID=1160 RepID=UPI0004003E33|nr:restriction endonuclease LlaI [Planktothrix agardhii]
MTDDTIKPIQKILFGCPGTGKSYKIREIAEEHLNIIFDSDTKILKNTVKTVFHPEYTYGDFMGKLLPLTQGTNVIYKFYPGHFLKVLGMAYRGLIEGNNEHYLLVIDELNRGNAAAIFGTVFQLLDRESDHWSSYEVDVSEMELVGLLNAMGYKPNVQTDGSIKIDENGTEDRFHIFCEKLERDLKSKSNNNGLRVLELLRQNKISITKNLSIIATINTSDESIYYLDSAFKRRWDWQYIPIDANEIEFKIAIFEETLNRNNLEKGAILSIPSGFDQDKNQEIFEELNWIKLINNINKIIKINSKIIRKIEDKQIGIWFIKPDEQGEISLEQVKYKLMFYLWDSVFGRDKKPLEEIISKAVKEEIKLITYDDFVRHTEVFLRYLYNN